jgi:hypothetical protein
MAHPEPIGLDMTTLDFEMSFNHITGGNVYNPELFEMEVTGYRAAIRTITDFAVNNTDTPTTPEEFTTRTETGEANRVAYITTGAVGTGDDALRRTHEQLSFDSDTSVYRQEQETTLGSDVTELTFDVDRADAHSMGVHAHGQSVIADLELVSPSGDVVYEFEGVTADRVGGKCCGLPEMTVSDPEQGTWRLRLDNYEEGGQPVELHTWTLAAESNPDPRRIENWGDEGYEQIEYDVTPFEFFGDYEGVEKDGIRRTFIEDGSVDQVTVEQVKDGALSEYDHAVLIHDYVSPTERISEGVSDNAKDGVTEGVTDPVYTDALDEFVNDGGNLVVTDAGTYVLPHLSNDLFDGSAISQEDVERHRMDVARYTDKNLEHPLFGDGDVRPIQNQLWKVQPLGYQTSGEAPMDLVAEDAFTAAANDGVASVAAWRDGLVATGSVTESTDSGRGIHFISSLLPPATQKHLHPFGLQNYTVTFLGYTVLTSALGFVQVRRAGDTERRYGRTAEWDVGGGGSQFSAGGSRTVENSVVTGRDAVRVDVTVSDVSSEAQVYDQLPDGWTLLERFSDAAAVEGEDGTVRLFHREDEDDEPGENDTVGADEGSVTFTYFAESPEGLDQSGPATFGPGEAQAVDEDATDTFAGETNALVFGADV